MPDKITLQKIKAHFKKLFPKAGLEEWNRMGSLINTIAETESFSGKVTSNPETSAEGIYQITNDTFPTLANQYVNSLNKAGAAIDKEELKSIKEYVRLRKEEKITMDEVPVDIQTKLLMSGLYQHPKAPLKAYINNKKVKGVIPTGRDVWFKGWHTGTGKDGVEKVEGDWDNALVRQAEKKYKRLIEKELPKPSNPNNYKTEEDYFKGNTFQNGGPVDPPTEGSGYMDILKRYMNPKNWGVDEYEGTFSQAFDSAKRAGEIEFIHNNKRFTTESTMSPQEELDIYGIPYAQATHNNALRDRVQQSIHPYEDPYGYAGYVNHTDNAILNKIIPGGRAGVDIIRGKKRPIPEGYTPSSVRLGRGDISQDMFDLYLGKPRTKKDDRLSVSPYKPTNAEDPNSLYYQLPNDMLFGDEDTMNMTYGEEGLGNIKDFIGSEDTVAQGSDYTLGKYTVNKGSDDKGTYVSYYDKWDLAPGGGKGDASMGIGKPLEFYGRQYYTTDEKGNVVLSNNKASGGLTRRRNYHTEQKQFKNGGSMGKKEDYLNLFPFGGGANFSYSPMGQNLFKPKFGGSPTNQFGFSGIPGVNTGPQMGADPTGMFGAASDAIGAAAPTANGVMSFAGKMNPIMQGVGILDSLAGFGSSFIEGAEGNYNTDAASYDFTKDYTSSVGEDRANKEAAWGSVPVIGGLGSLFSKSKSRKMQATVQDKDAEYNSFNAQNVAKDNATAANMAFASSKYASGGSLDSLYGNGGTYEATMGGTHEQDPLGGTTISHDENGTPNKIEEGEYVVGDFVFTDRF